MEAPVTAKEATERFLSDRQSMNLSKAMMRKYRNVAAELVKELEDKPVKSVTTDDLRRIREAWKLSPVIAQKRLEMLRKFFTFCEDSDWIEKNPAKKVNAPPAKYDPTLPFSEEEMEKILWAAESIREVRWSRLFGQFFRVLKWKNYSVSGSGGGNVKIGFIDFQGLREGWEKQFHRFFHAFLRPAFPRPACVARYAARFSCGRLKYTRSGVWA